MSNREAERLREVRTFPSLVKYLREDLRWPIESDSFEDLTFDWDPEELGIDAANAAKIQEIKQLRPLATGQPWGIFFVKFEPRRLPVVALRRILSQVAIKKRASANRSDRAAWHVDDLLFISNYGEGDKRQISFAHFSQDDQRLELPTLKVLGWDNLDTALHMDAVADKLHRHLTWPTHPRDSEAWRSEWRAAFTLHHREVITTSRDLSIRLAELARAIRDRIKTALAIETTNGRLTKLMKTFQEALVHDLDADGFADMYAQTIAYGLLSARIADPEKRTADDFAGHMRTNPFLRELMDTFLMVGGRQGKAGGPGIDFDELGVSDVVELLDDANMEAVVRDFGDRNPREDPVIHFYEHFLAAYDKEQKVSRGVFYTPRPVVSYIVRSVHELLRTEFGLTDGLADTTTWGDMAKRHKGLKVPDGVDLDHPFVQILDPATGTGTFLVEAIDLIHRTMTAKWERESGGPLLAEAQRRWNEYVPKHLLPRLHGYELLMAPYAIAHLKVGLKLHETGYRFGSDARAHIYLTNALEPGGDFSGTFSFALPALAHEAQAVNEVKRTRRFLVVIGNPPYSVNSANKKSSIDAQLAEYKHGLVGERNLKPLNDDYIKFLRLAHLALAETGCGVLGMITNHSYTSARLFRGVRLSLLEGFSSVRFLDLRGDMGRDPGMAHDENVFDIQQGVGISLLSRTMAAAPSTQVVHKHELVGRREDKYAWLAQNDVCGTPWRQINAVPPLFGFEDVAQDVAVEYEGFLPVNHMFTVGNVGYQTHRDEFVVHFTRQSVIRSLEMFRQASGSEEQLSKRFCVESNRDWSLLAAHRALAKDAGWDARVVQTLYRPFDLRMIAYAPYLIDYDRRELMRHMKEGNLGLLVSKVFDEHEFTSVLATKWIVESKVADRTRGAHLFPLRLAAAESASGLRLSGEGKWSTNLSKVITAQLRERLGVAVGIGETSARRDRLGDEEVFGYVYGVLHAPGYRQRYSDFLKSDFPRVPIARELGLFRQIARLGTEVARLHLLEGSPGSDVRGAYAGPRCPAVERVGWSDETVWLDTAATRRGGIGASDGPRFQGVPEAVWTFHIGGYQVCEKWLKDRKGRKLSAADIAHYQKIVVALSETIRLMKEIDEVIEKHGGWPGAFQAAEASGADSVPRLERVAERKGGYRGKSS